MLSRHPAQSDHEDHSHCSYGRPLDNGGVGVVEVQTFNLFVATDAEAGFELFGGTIVIPFNVECPSRG